MELWTTYIFSATSNLLLQYSHSSLPDPAARCSGPVQAEHYKCAIVLYIFLSSYFPVMGAFSCKENTVLTTLSGRTDVPPRTIPSLTAHRLSITNF